MPHKTSPDPCEDFDIDSPSVMMDNLGLGALISDDYEDDGLEFDDTDSIDSVRVTNRGKAMKRSGSSWQQIEALNESRHLRALLKEYYED